MTELAGQAEGSSAQVTTVAEVALAERCEVIASGTGETMRVKFAEALSKAKVQLAVFADNAGVPGALISEAWQESGESSATEVTLTLKGTVAATKGEFVWLAVLANKATKFKFTSSGSVPGYLSNAKVAKVTEAITWEKGGAAKQGPYLLELLGTESGGGSPVQGKATGLLLLTGTSKGIAVQVVQGKATGPVLLTGTSEGIAVQVVKGQATGPLILTGTSHGKVAGTLFGKATGAILLTGTAKGLAQQVVLGKATGPLVLTGTAAGVLKAVVQAKATGTLVLTGRSKGHTLPEPSSKRTVIFIFDE